MESTNSDLQDRKQTANKSKGSCLKIGFLVVFAILFLLSTALWIFVFNVQRVVFDPENLSSAIIKNIDTETLFQSSVPPVSDDQTFELGSLLNGLSSEDSIDVKELLFPDKFLEDLLQDSIEAFLNWTESGDASLEFVWDMTPIKNRLAGEEGQEALKIAFRSLPDCTTDEMTSILTQMQADPSAPLIVDRLCQVAKPYEDQQMQIFTTVLDSANREIPETYVVTLINEDLGSTGTMRLIKGTLGFIRMYGRWGWVISLSLLGLILLVGVRSLDSFSGWVGIPLFLSGILVSILSVVLRSLILRRLSSVIESRLSGLLSEMSAGIMRVLPDQILGTALLHGVILLAIGGVLIGVLIIQKIIKASKK